VNDIASGMEHCLYREAISGFGIFYICGLKVVHLSLGGQA